MAAQATPSGRRHPGRDHRADRGSRAVTAHQQKELGTGPSPGVNAVASRGPETSRSRQPQGDFETRGQGSGRSRGRGSVVEVGDEVEDSAAAAPLAVCPGGPGAQASGGLPIAVPSAHSLYVVTSCRFAPEPFIAAMLPCQRVRSRARHDAEPGPALVVIDPSRPKVQRPASGQQVRAPRPPRTFLTQSLGEP